MFDTLSCPSPFTHLSRIMRGLYDTAIVLFVSKGIVRDGDDHGFVQKGPFEESPVSYHLFSNIRALEPVVGAIDEDNHRRISTVGTVNIDAVEAKLCMMREGLHRGEASKSRST